MRAQRYNQQFSPQSPGRTRSVWARGFTAVELLVVVSISMIMLTLVVPSLIKMKGGGDFSGALSELAGILEQGRAYAMANNTHVFVGIEEVDSSQSASAVPQHVATAQSGGRVVAVAVASRDGTSGYDSAAPTALSGSSLVVLGKVQRCENLHLADLNASGAPPTTGGMARASADPASRVGNGQCVSLTSFTYPLSGPVQYSFTTVIEFAPQGAAKIVSQSGGSISKIIEIGIQPTHQNAIPPLPANQNSGNQAAIQIDGLTGSIRIYKP